MADIYDDVFNKEKLVSDLEQYFGKHMQGEMGQDLSIMFTKVADNLHSWFVNRIKQLEDLTLEEMEQFAPVTTLPKGMKGYVAPEYQQVDLPAEQVMGEAFVPEHMSPEFGSPDSSAEERLRQEQELYMQGLVKQFAELQALNPDIDFVRKLAEAKPEQIESILRAAKEKHKLQQKPEKEQLKKAEKAKAKAPRTGGES